MSGPIPAGYETDEDEYEDELYTGTKFTKTTSSFSFLKQNNSDAANEEPIDWQSAIQSSMNDSTRLNDTTLHSANSKLQDDTTLQGDTTMSNGNKANDAKNGYNPFEEYKTLDGLHDLDLLNDRNLPDEDVDDDQSLPPHGNAKNLKIYGDLELFLCYIKEDDLIDMFDKHEVTFRQLLTCNEQDLINIGIDKVGIRKKILEATSQVHARKWEPSSLTDLSAQDLYTSPGVFLVVSDIKKHLGYIRDTLYHLKNKIQSDDEVLELGKDFVGTKKIIQEASDLVEASKDLHKSAVEFTDYIRREKLDLPKLGPANQIDQRLIERTFRKSSIFSGYTAMTATVLLLLVAFKITKS